MQRLLWNMSVILAFMLPMAVHAESQVMEAKPAKDKVLLNVSYDPTRRFYEDYNQMFAEHWKTMSGETVVIRQSHGGSGKQARAVIEGLPADIISLATAHDINMVAERAGLLDKDWSSAYPNQSTPYYSTIVFLVRAGNPKKITGWADVIRDDVVVVTPNPKTSGGARWNYLAAYSYAQATYQGDEGKIAEYMKKLFANVPVFDTGARGSVTTFVQRGIGDVLITWENEAYLASHELGEGEFEMVVPDYSVQAEPPVAVVTKTAEKKGNLDVAKEYVNYLYSDEAQKLIAKHYYRPYDKKIAKTFAAQFPTIQHMATIRDFGGWPAVHAKHFAEGGLFDQAVAQKTKDGTPAKEKDIKKAP